MKRFIIFFLILLLPLALARPAIGAGGDASDPVVSLSYVNTVFTPELSDASDRLISGGLGQTYSASLKTLAVTIGAHRLSVLQSDSTSKYAAGTMLLKQGDVLTIAPGCKVTLKNGTVTADTSFLVDVTNGRRVPKMDTLTSKILYMMANSDTGELLVKSATAELTVHGVYRLNASRAVDYGSMATALNTMGLFLGTGTGYTLESSASRAQGLVMFLRILGLEKQALSYTGSSPFTDVPKSHWAYRYVAYAYHNGLTTGTSATTFSPDRTITCQHYATFLLRALNYQEGTEFAYATAVQNLKSLGLFTQAETNILASGTFLRYKMVYLSYYGLFGVDQDAGNLLMERLVNDGAVQQQALWDGICQVNGGRID